VQRNRIRRCPLAALRNPHAERFVFFTRRLMPSVRALVTPEQMNASIAGHHISTVVARVVSSSISAEAHQS
jgi:hypothetical protein